MNEEPQAGPLPELSKYRMIRRIGQGGMGSVYLAQRHGTTDLCIVKVINEDLLDNDTVAQRFLREAHVASTLHHDNIARLTDAGREGDRFYLAVEFIAGQELEALMRALFVKGKMLPPAFTLTIAQDVLRGLHYAHEVHDSNGQHLEIVHRDLSPRNVMITFDGAAKIIDFGLVRTNLGEWRTLPGMLLGTLRYMSPEQATASPVDRRSDLYSFATVLHEALTGRFLIPDGERIDVLRNVVLMKPEPLSALNPTLPEALSDVLATALNKAADDRFPDAESFRAALFAAAPELSSTPRASIGAFLAGEFPQEKLDAEQALRRAKMSDGTLVRDAPEFEATRAGVPGMAEGDGPVFEATRAASLQSLAEDLPNPVTAIEPNAPSGMAAPLAPPPAAARWRGALAGLVALAALLLVVLVLRQGPSEVAPVEWVPPPPPSDGVGVRAAPREVAEVSPEPVRARDAEAPSAPPPTRRASTPEPPPTRRASTPEPPPPPAVPAPTGPEARVKAILASNQLTARQRQALQSCFEQAKFANRTRPDYARCFARADTYLGSTP